MNCEQRVTLDYIPNTAATIGVTADGITDTLDLTDAIHNVESKTHLKLNRLRQYHRLGSLQSPLVALR